MAYSRGPFWQRNLPLDFSGMTPVHSFPNVPLFRQQRMEKWAAGLEVIFLLWQLVRWLFSCKDSWLSHSSHFSAQKDDALTLADETSVGSEGRFFVQTSAAGLVSYETHIVVRQTLLASGWLKYILLHGVWIRRRAMAFFAFLKWCSSLPSPLTIPSKILGFFFSLIIFKMIA